MFEKKKIKKSSDKKNSYSKEKNKKIQISDNKIINYISYIGIIIILGLSIFILNNMNLGDFKIYNEIKKTKINNISDEDKKKIEFLKNQEEKKKKEEIEEKLRKQADDDKENILIIGRGGYGNDAPELTDSLILLSYYKKKNSISMLSIPRDLYINYGIYDKNGKEKKGKINALYVTDLEKTQNREKSIKKLEKKIEEITNEKIDYYVNIDFRGFVKLINEVGGVKVNVVKTLVDEKYPDNNHGHQTFILRKGKWNLDGKTALKYVRSRKNTGGDFGRSQRQQQVIKSLKEKLLSSEYLTSPSKIKDLYNIFDKYISTDIGLLDFVKLATNLKLQKNLNFYSSGLNTSCIKDDECDKGGFLFYPQRKFFGGQSVLLSGNSTYKNLGNYNKIHKYADLIFNSPSIFKENFKISIFSNSKDKKEALILRQELKKYGLKINVLERIGVIPDEFIDENGGFGNKQITEKNKIKKNKITLLEYNKLLKNKKTNNLNKDNLKIRKTSLIGREAHNKNTKIILNNVDLNSNSVKFLKKYFNLKNKDIIINNSGPKYAKDKNTRIEILFKNN